MSFTTIFRSPISNLSQVAKKLDEKIVTFCSQLAKRLEVDEANMLVEFQACLKYFEMEETKEIEKIKTKKLSDEEKEEKKRFQEEEKQRKLHEKEEEKQRKLHEKEVEKQRKLQEKEEEKLKKQQEKEALLLKKKEEKEAEKARQKELKEAKKAEKSSPKSSSSSPKSSPKASSEGSKFETELVRPFDINTAFWSGGKPKSIKGEKVYLHSSGLVLKLEEDDTQATLFGYKGAGGGVYEESKMVLDDFLPIKQWAKNCGIKVPSLPDLELDDEEEEEVIIESDAEEDDDLELSE
jgi:hypothetical protein